MTRESRSSATELPASVRPTSVAPGAAVPARVALVGDRSAAVTAHGRIPMIIEALRQRDGLGLDPYWIPTPDAALPAALDGFDGIWLLPGSPYRSEHGAVQAARHAREQGIPFLGTCGGFQHAVLEFARNVCGLSEVAHAEVTPEASEMIVVALECSLKGHEGGVNLEPGSLAERVLGVERSIERYYCSYGIAASYLDRLRRGGLRFSGVDDVGDVRVMELPGHPFFLATLFQPELSSSASRAHPVIRAFAAAAAGVSTATTQGSLTPR